MDQSLLDTGDEWMAEPIAAPCFPEIQSLGESHMEQEEE